MPRRVTQSDIAKEAGVSQVTVSLAMRNHPRIPKKTRNHIRQIANRLNYRPDPVLSSLVAYRQSNKPVNYLGTLAWITNFDTPDGWRSISHFVQYLKGAEKRAKQLGFNVDAFWMRQPNLTPRRISNILHTRNIQGLIVAPQPSPHATIRLQWSRFSAVKIGYSLKEPRIHIVSNCHFRSLVAVYDRLREMGYQRIGMVLRDEHDERVENNYVAGFMLRNNRRKADQQIPHLLLTDQEQERFSTWRERHRPDAIISFGYLPLEAWLTECGLRVPQDVGLACPSIQEEHPEYAGIDEEPQKIGATAVDVVVGMIHRNETGLPERPVLTLLEGKWKRGRTARRRKPPKAAPT